MADNRRRMNEHLQREADMIQEMRDRETNIQNRDWHPQQHFPVNPIHRCEICGEAFDDPDDFEIHMYEHDRRGYGKQPKKSSDWITFVKQVQAKYGVSYKEALKIASNLRKK